MKTFIRNCLTVLLTTLSLSSHANPCDDGGIGGTGAPLSRGIGGTGITSTEQGIGGTGITNNQKGIGGTGIVSDSGVGGTGIVGVITGFGSICVNGLEIHFFNDTPVDLDGKQISTNGLSVGQVVSVRAGGKEQLIAHEIHAFHLITGPITGIDLATKNIKVMGQTVNALGVQLKNMKVGQWVSVSGLRNADGSVEASRIDLAADQKVARAVGSLSAQGNSTFIGGTKIIGISKINGDQNADTRLTGTWDGKSFNVKDVSPGPVSELMQKVDVFNVQGIAARDTTNGKVKLAGQNIAVSAGAKLIGSTANADIVGKAVIVSGQVKNGKASAESIQLRPIQTEIKNRQDRQTSTPKSPSKDLGEKSSVQKDKGSEIKESERHSRKVDKSETLERIHKIEKVEKIEKIESIDKIEKIEVPEKVEIPEKIEKVEIPEKIEKVDKNDD